jgi:transposase
MAYSEDFRKKVLEVIEEDKLTPCKAANHFKLDLKTVKSWLVSIERKPHSNRYKKLCLEALKADVEKYPDAYQYERAERLGVKQNTICYGLKKLKISYKKKPYTPAGGREKAYFISEKD